MVRTIDREARKALLGDAVVMLVRSRVPPDRPLPPALPTAGEESEAEHQAIRNDDGWSLLLNLLARAHGCRHLACSRVAEDPAIALFVIIWWDQSSVDAFSASSDYNLFLAALESPLLPIQTIKFSARLASNPAHLRGWLSLFTVTLPHPVTDAQRALFAALSGPRYPHYDAVTMCPAVRGAMMALPAPSRAPALQHGWAVAPRTATVQAEDGTATREVQDGVIYRKWISREAEAEWRKGMASVGVEPDWQQDLSEIGALDAREEHVDLSWVANFEDKK